MHSLHTTSTLVPPLVLPSFPLTQVSDQELSQFAELIYRRTGIRVMPEKKALLSNRLRRRLRETGLADFAAYHRHLRRLKDSDPEWDAFLQEITTHETYLFRDENQWEWIRRSYVPELAKRARNRSGVRTLRIWSAACSTGDEPITAACCLAAELPNFARWKVEILGTDIGVGALEQAKTALFGQRAMRLVPDGFRLRFFTQLPHMPVWQVQSAIVRLIRYRQHNLLTPLKEHPFDLVILKNVLIYFDADSKRRAVENVKAAVRPGGVLLTGASEGVADEMRRWKRLQPWAYRKPETWK
ncbi:MAG: protein-glutamate O-methyltransferase CheR [Pirellulales bacterium]|nr:protein-glutamate O-methyltransferase CheR [Pirellulales bacterium]